MKAKEFSELRQQAEMANNLFRIFWRGSNQGVMVEKNCKDEWDFHEWGIEGRFSDLRLNFKALLRADFGDIGKEGLQNV